HTLTGGLPVLSDREEEQIQAIFIDGLSEGEVGARLGITQSLVNKRKARLLLKLRKIRENKKLRKSHPDYITERI
ncbi:sigma factor-like helix-turn-helix DNA-binding protein, partial [Streptococcus suis]